jgi:hypothetical protein
MKPLPLTIFAVLMAACGSAPAQPPRTSVKTVSSPRASFDQYQTFNFGPANQPGPGFDVTQRSLEVQRRLSALVRSAFQKRGYSQAVHNPDLVVKISAGAGAQEREIRRGDERRVEATPLGFISIDVYDAKTGNDVWHGTGQSEIDLSTIDSALLASAVEVILEGFPARAESQQPLSRH